MKQNELRYPGEPFSWQLPLPAIILLLFSLPFSPLQAQSTSDSRLERISMVERGDENGYVVRHHLSAAVDSFRIHQSSPELIQTRIWGSGVDIETLALPPIGKMIRDLHVHPLNDGIGIDLEIQAPDMYEATGYPDQNGRDLILALTRRDTDRVERLTADRTPIHWGEHQEEADSPIVSAREESPVSTQQPEPVATPPATTGIPDEAPDVEPESSHDHEADFSEIFPRDEEYDRISENFVFDTVVIDAGHGGKDPGSIGHGNIYEKRITLTVAKKLGDYINEHLPDLNVVYTRDNDRFIELAERGQIANRAQGDLFVSIHANSYPRNPNVRGSEVYFLGLARTQSALEVMKRENSVLRLENGNGQELSEEDLIIYELANAGNLTVSERIAEKVEHQFRARAGRHSRGVKQAQFVVLYHASMPALLVELGFLTNPDEAKFLNSDYGQAIVASALFRAIRDYKVEYDRSRNLTSGDQSR
ncbi:MAG: N-acetylmuramoyl-L-alanine amidase [Balneolaceae bacterium]